MRGFVSLRSRLAVLAAVLGFSLAVSGSKSAVSSPSYAAGEVTPAILITRRDVAESNRKIESAYTALIKMWATVFNAIGRRFGPPDLVPYEGGVQTACGIMRGSNALYCPRDNSIYFDDVFVAGQAKSAARDLGTDGDMAGIGVIAHEMGHAVAMQLGHISRTSYENESTADCLAGAFAQQSSRDGMIEDGDIDEAFYAMSSAGDPTPQLTGDTRMDGWIIARFARGSHGTREQRMQNFKTGLDGGAGACLPEFKGLR
jgi:predicted metalloprotease